MLDCISEEGFWGDEGDYNFSEMGSYNYLEGPKREYPTRIQTQTDHDYYHNWQHVSNIREYENNYSVVFKGLLLSIPKKLVRGQKKDKLFVHTATFYKIFHKKQDSSCQNINSDI